MDSFFFICLSLSLSVSHCLSLSLSVSHWLSLSLSVSHWLSLSLSVSHWLSLSLSVSIVVPVFSISRRHDSFHRATCYIKWAKSSWTDSSTYNYLNHLLSIK